MSRKLVAKAERLLAEEQGTVVKEWGGRVAFGLVYPNTYSVGMSNLGFQTIYRHLNARSDVVCERVFWPDPEDLPEHRRTGTAPFSVESKRPLAAFDLVGFSVTYEGDYVNVLRLLRLAGIPLRPEERRAEDPVILMGGVCAFSNPEPIAPFMDLVVVGEGEEIVGEIVEAYRAAASLARADLRREALKSRLEATPGIYLPDRYEVRYAADGTVEAVSARSGAPPIVVKRRLRSVDAFQTLSLLRTPNAQYGHLAMLEVGKGCGRGCRFCLEGEVYRPVRHRSVETLAASLNEIAQHSKRVGLVGACVSDYPWIGGLLRAVEAAGLELSVSSLRADSLTEELVASLARGGHRTLTIAPEAGTERLRQVIRKSITNDQLYAACELVRRYGIPNLKCYFMIGLPGETDADVDAIGDLARSLLERLRAPSPDGQPFGRLTLSISSFVPKPWTPFQWVAFDRVASLETKLRRIKAAVRRERQVRVLHESPREAHLQAILARGDRKVAGLLEAAAGLDGDWRAALRAWGSAHADLYACRVRRLDETFPWDHMDVGVKKAGLLREYQRSGLVPMTLALRAPDSCTRPHRLGDPVAL